MYPHLTEDSEIFFEVGSDGGALFENRDGQPVIIWNDRRGASVPPRSSWWVPETFITFLIPPPTSQAEYKIFINQTD